MNPNWYESAFLRLNFAYVDHLSFCWSHFRSDHSLGSGNEISERASSGSGGRIDSGIVDVRYAASLGLRL